MLRVSFILTLFISITVFGQQSDKYRSEYARFYKAEDLFEKEKFSAAHEEFKIFMKEEVDPENPLYVKAKYYNALCALYLYHADAEKLLLGFLAEYPESIYRQTIYLELGRYYYQKRKYEKTIEWLAQIDVYELEEEDKDEYYFKLGYSYFREEQLKEARNSFFEVLNMESEYQAPSLYYYSHIAYLEENYQVALEGFLKLKDHEYFKETVPYYICQIYYMQGKYEELLAFAPEVKEGADTKNSLEMSLLIGDAYYRLGKYQESVPYLEEYNKRSKTTRDEDYQLGYAYFKSKMYMNAIKMFDKVARISDSLGQTALYHIGESYLAQDEYHYARNAFQLASEMPYDADIEEDALYQYCVLSYKVDYNPFNEAVKAMNLYLERYPNSDRKEDMYQYLVNIYTSMKNYKAALNSLDRIENKDFKMKTAYQIMAFNYGVELYANGNYPHAVNHFRLVKRYPLDPKLNALSFYWIGESKYQLNELDSAIKYYRVFLEEPGGYNLPEHNDAYYNIAYCYYKKKDYTSSIQSFRTFTQDVNETDKEKLTDAYLRIGDCYFLEPNDEQAILFYRKAIESRGGQIDYAKYQIGLSYGYQGKYDDKVAMMKDIIANHPRSTFLVPAKFEIGEAYRLMDNSHHTEALNYYNKVVVENPGHPLVIEAIFEMAGLHLYKGEYRKAETLYLRIVNEFDNPQKKKEAIARLKDVYAALNEPEKYLELLQDQGEPVDASATDTLFFETAFDFYQEENYPSAITSFDKYLNRFPNGTFNTESYYYRGTSYLKTEQLAKCVQDYKVVLSLGTFFFTEDAAYVVSDYVYKEKNYQEAIKYFEILEKVAQFPENKLAAQIGLMRSNAFLEKYSAAALFANKVLNDPLALDNVKTEAHYVLGHDAFISGNYTVAREEFELVTKNSNSAIGAESKYMIALTYHLEEEYKTSEGEIRQMMKNWAGYDYWIAKALILQAKNSIGLEDYVQAEYTLNSVLNNYKNQDDGILEEAQHVMDELQKLKNKEKNLPVPDNNTIEIEGGGDE